MGVNYNKKSLFTLDPENTKKYPQEKFSKKCPKIGKISPPQKRHFSLKFPILPKIPEKNPYFNWTHLLEYTPMGSLGKVKSGQIKGPRRHSDPGGSVSLGSTPRLSRLSQPGVLLPGPLPGLRRGPHQPVHLGVLRPRPADGVWAVRWDHCGEVWLRHEQRSGLRHWVSTW